MEELYKTPSVTHERRERYKMNASRKIFISKQRFRNAMRFRQVSFAELSKGIHVAVETIKYCVKCEAIMPDNLDLICKYLDVSPLYIQGKQTEKAPDPSQYESELRNYKDSNGSPVFDENEIIEFCQICKKRRDPEGLRIPSYEEAEIVRYHEEYFERKEKEKEMLLDYCIKNFSKSLITADHDRSYFEKHFSDIKDRIDEAITAYIFTHEE